MADDNDPIKHAARWRPRPDRLVVRRSSGELETYAVAAGRRAWSSLRKLLPMADALEVLGLAGDNIVGRWQASPESQQVMRAAELEELDVDDEEDDDPPSDEARMFRWLAREFRGIFTDQLKANRELLAVMADAMRVQRDAFAQRDAFIRAPAGAVGDEDDDGYSKVAGLLQSALQLYATQQRAPASPAPPSEFHIPGERPPPASAVRPPRDSGDFDA